MMKKITTVREFGADGTLVKETVTEEDEFPCWPVHPLTGGAGQVLPNTTWPYLTNNHGSHCACERCVPRIT